MSESSSIWDFDAPQFVDFGAFAPAAPGDSFLADEDSLADIGDISMIAPRASANVFDEMTPVRSMKKTGSQIIAGTPTTVGDICATSSTSSNSRSHSELTTTSPKFSRFLGGGVSASNSTYSSSSSGGSSKYTMGGSSSSLLSLSQQVLSESSSSRIKSLGGASRSHRSSKARSEQHSTSHFATESETAASGAPAYMKPTQAAKSRGGRRARGRSRLNTQQSLREKPQRQLKVIAIKPAATSKASTMRDAEFPSFMRSTLAHSSRTVSGSAKGRPPKAMRGERTGERRSASKNKANAESVPSFMRPTRAQMARSKENIKNVGPTQRQEMPPRALRASQKYQSHNISSASCMTANQVSTKARASKPRHAAATKNQRNTRAGKAEVPSYMRPTKSSVRTKGSRSADASAAALAPRTHQRRAAATVSGTRRVARTTTLTKPTTPSWAKPTRSAQAKSRRTGRQQVLTSEEREMQEIARAKREAKERRVANDRRLQAMYRRNHPQKQNAAARVRI